MERVDLMAEKDTLAARLVSRYVKLLKKIKNDPTAKVTEKQLRNDLLFNLHSFKEKCKEIDSTFPSYSNFDNIIDNLIFLDKSMVNSDERIDNIMNKIDKISNKLEIS